MSGGFFSLFNSDILNKDIRLKPPAGYRSVEEVYRKIIFRHAQGEQGKTGGYYMEQKEKKRRKKKSSRGAYYDYNLLAIVILLICFGLIMLYLSLIHI